MAIIRFGKDLLKDQPKLKYYVLDHFEHPTEVTTIEESCKGFKVYIVTGEGVPNNGEIDVTLTMQGLSIPEEANVFKDLYLNEFVGYWTWRETKEYI